MFWFTTAPQPSTGIRPLRPVKNQRAASRHWRAGGRLAALQTGCGQPSQPATIKLEAYPYTRFGTLQAQLQHLAADAVVDENMGERFSATLPIASPDKAAAGQSPNTPIKLAPGLNLTAEIRTGKRRVIDFLISPLRQEVETAGRER